MNVLTLTSQQANSPEWKKYMYHANRAPGLLLQGLFRESTDEYLIAFQCAPTLTECYRFELFNEGISSFLLPVDFDRNKVPTSVLGYVEPTKKDINLMRKVFKDKNEGSGHVMDYVELCAETFHYENPPKWTLNDTGPKSIQHLLRNCSTRPEPTSRDDNMRNSMNGYGVRGGKLVRYPFYSPSMVSPPYSLNPPPKVRNDDMVWVVAENLNRIERFWVAVVSVTSGGVVTGISISTLHSFPIHEQDWVYFPVSCVLDVERGKHWRK